MAQYLGTPTPMRGASWAVGSARCSEVPCGSPKDLVPVPVPEAQRDPLLHKKIRKSFAGNWYYGEVINIDKDLYTGERFYHVAYEDGDEEHLGEPDVHAFLHQGSHVPARQPLLSGPHTPAPTQKVAACMAASVAASRRISFNTSGPTPRRSMEPMTPVPGHALQSDVASGGFGTWSMAVAVAVLALIVVKTLSYTCWGCLSSVGGGLSDQPVGASDELMFPPGMAMATEPSGRPFSWFAQPSQASESESTDAFAAPTKLPPAMPDWVTHPPTPPPKPVAEQVAPLSSGFNPFAHDSNPGGTDGFPPEWQEALESTFAYDIFPIIALVLFVAATLFFIAACLDGEKERPTPEDAFHVPDFMHETFEQPVSTLPPTPLHGFDVAPSPSTMADSSAALVPAFAAGPPQAGSEATGAQQLAALLGKPNNEDVILVSDGIHHDAPVSALVPLPMLEPTAGREPLSPLPVNSQLPELQVGGHYITYSKPNKPVIVRLESWIGNKASVQELTRQARHRRYAFCHAKKPPYELPVAALQSGPFEMSIGQPPPHIKPLFDKAVGPSRHDIQDTSYDLVSGPRFRHISTLKKMTDMGYPDNDRVREVINVHNGDLNTAIAELSLM